MMVRASRDLRPSLARRVGPPIVAIVLCLAGFGDLVGAVPVADGRIAARPKPDCLKSGGSLVAADGNVVVLRVSLRPQAGAKRQDRLFACWVPTGRRFPMLDEVQLLDDTFTGSGSIEIVGGRYVGLRLVSVTALSTARGAEVWDARTARKVHTSTPCDAAGSSSPASGVDEAVFLPGGGMAYSCGQLRLADGHGDRQLEPPGTDVSDLAVATAAAGNLPRLYWSVRAANAVATPKSLVLS